MSFQSTYAEFRRKRYFQVPKSKIVLGPWNEGINLTMDSNRLRPNELQECINYIIKPDGRLVTRPPVTGYGTSKGLPGGSFIIGQGSTGLFRSGTLTNAPVASYDDGTNVKMVIYSSASDTWGAYGASLPTNFPMSQIILYNFTPYVAASDNTNALEKLYIGGGININTLTNIGAFSTAVTGALGSGTFIQNKKMVVFKDRMLAVGDGIVLWSKATDPTIWAAPDGGYVKFNGSASAGCLVYQDSLYIFGDQGIWRFTWTSDPSIDGVFENVSTTPILGSLLYNNEIFVNTPLGVFKYINGIFVEISQKISIDYQNRISAITGNNQPYLVNFNHLLFVGPFVVTGGTQYYVLDLKIGTWTIWQFNSTVPGPSGGPYQGLTGVSGSGYNEGIKKYWWTNNGKAYSIPADALLGKTTYPNYDKSDTGSNFWIGQKFTTAEIDLGDDLSWKRIFKSLVDAAYFAVTFTSGNSKYNYILDGVSISLTPPQAGKLAWGKSYRAKKFAFQYDSLTGTVIGTGTTPGPELTSVDRIIIEVASSKEVNA